MPVGGRRARRLGRRLADRLPRAASLRLMVKDKLAVPSPGCVTVFSAEEIIGWLPAPDTGSTAPRVSLYLNDLDVARTWASEPVDHGDGTARYEFRLGLQDIWHFCRTSDRLTVRVAGKPVEIVGHGRALRPDRNGHRSAATLRKRLDSGYVFSHGGKLQLSKTLDVAWQSAVLDLYARVRRIVADQFGHDVFLIYGSLLGAVREHGFIGHDRDFDCAFISRYKTGPLAVGELAAIAYALIDDGLDVECRRTALHVHDSDGGHAKVDLFHLFFDATGKLCFPFGIAGESTFTTENWRGTREIEFAGQAALVPVAAEELVEHIYGASWRRPTPGFDWARDRTARARGASVPAAVLDGLYWANYYRHSAPAVVSTLCHYVIARDDLRGTVVDLGCGDGTDALALAGAGRAVLGIDRSKTGIDRAVSRAAELGTAVTTAFDTGDVGDPEALAKRIAQARELGPERSLLFYAHRLLDSIGKAAQGRLLDAIAGSAEPGDAFVAEFRTSAFEPTRHKAPQVRRAQDGPEFAASLHARYGFTVRDQHAGSEIGSGEGQDAQTYRVVALVIAE